MSSPKNQNSTPHTAHETQAFVSRDWRGLRLHYDAELNAQTHATLKLALSAYGYVVPHNSAMSAHQWIDAICKVYDRHDPRHAAVISAISTASGIEVSQPQPYDLKRIAWELEQTALGHAHFGSALRAAKDIPGTTSDERALLDRYATGSNAGTDHVALQELAIRVRTVGHHETTHDEELPAYVSNYLEHWAKHRSLINALASEIAEITDDAHWELVDEMKGSLSCIASASATDACAQEESIRCAEEWVTAHLSQTDIHGDASMAIWLKGEDTARAYLYQHRATQHPSDRG